MSKIHVLYAGLAALALSACGQTSQSSSTSAPASAPAAPGAAAPTDAAQAPEGSSTAQPISSATVAAATYSGQPCGLDTIDGSYDAHVTLDRTKPHAFRGWLLNEAKQPAGQFSLVLKGAQDYAIAASTGETRKDVSEYFKDPAATLSGYNVSADLSMVPVGAYSITLVMQNQGRSFFCDSVKTVVVD